jgi:flagellar basal body-associated protein FliL
LEEKSGFFVLIIVIAFLSLTLALLAGYVFFFSGGDSESANEVGRSTKVAIPADEELATFPLFEGAKIFNLKNVSEKQENSNSIHVIKVSVEINYFKKVEGIKNVEEKLMAYNGKIKELVGNYFLNMTLEEVAKTEAKDKAKKELTKQINELLLASERIKTDIVYTLAFDEWFFQ